MDRTPPCAPPFCRRLFLAKPAFCSTLLEINALCYELRTGENTRLMAPLSPNTHSSIDAFLEEQVQCSAVQCSAAQSSAVQHMCWLEGIVRLKIA